MHRKIFAVILIFSLTLALSTTSIFAVSPQDDFLYTLDYDNNTARVDEYIGSDDWVVIPPAFSRIVFDGGIPSVHFYIVIEIAQDAFNSSDASYVKIPDTVTTIGEGAFADCVNLEYIVIPDSVTHIGTHAFSQCFSLQSVIIGLGLEEINSRTFFNCTSLKNIIIGENVKVIRDYGFEDCFILTGITLPKGLEQLGTSAFSGCYDLKQINVDVENTYFTSIGGVLFSKDLKELVRFPPGIRGDYTVPGHVDIIGAYAFDGSADLKNIIIPDSVKEIGEYAFHECMSLETVVIPEGITEIKEGTFIDCISLESVVLPQSLDTIGEKAFLICDNLSEILIPENVTNIMPQAFMDCMSLKKAVFMGDAPTEAGAGIFDNAHQDFAIYYYESAQGWTNPWNGYPTVLMSDPTPTPSPSPSPSPESTVPSESESYRESQSETVVKTKSAAVSESEVSESEDKAAERRPNAIVISLIIFFSMILLGSLTALIIYLVMSRKGKEATENNN